MLHNGIMGYLDFICVINFRYSRHFYAKHCYFYWQTLRPESEDCYFCCMPAKFVRMEMTVIVPTNIRL